jgi:hypothetical protein
MKKYVDEICRKAASQGTLIEVEKIQYRDGAVVAPLDFELDEFSGVWFVQFAVAVNRKLGVFTLDLGQARFRFGAAGDVSHPEAITKNQALVKRDELIEALDQRFGANQVNTAASSSMEAMEICQRLWPCQERKG